MRTYEKYKDSGIGWVGKVPEDWRKCRFKNIMNLITDASTSNNKIGLENIESGTGKFVQTDSEFEGNGVAFMPHDIVYGKLRPYLQKVWCADFEGNAVGDFFVFRNKCNSVSSFLKYVLLSNNFTQFANGTTYGAKMPRVSSNAILDQEYYIPTLSEQEAIANYLDKKTAEIDKIIAEREKKIELLNELKSSIISRAVTKGINPHAKMKDSGISWLGKVPEYWEVCKVKHHYKLVTGFTPATKVAKFYDTSNGHTWITIADLKGKVVTDSTNKISDFYLNEYHQEKVKEGSLLYSFKLSVGQVAFAGKDLYTNEAIAAFQNSDKVNLKYFFYAAPLFIIHNSNINIYGAHILNQDLIKNAYTVFPPLPEQEAIANYLDKKTEEIDKTISAIKKECILYKEYKQSLISEVVTGKRKVID